MNEHDLFGFVRIGLFVALTLAGIFGAMGSMILRARAARNWPKAKGLIVRSELVPEHQNDDAGTPEIFTYPVVEYAYAVDGIKYQSRQLSIVPGATPGPSPNELVAMYPSGATVPVFYNPANPADGALDCRLPAKVVERMVKSVAVIAAIGLTLIFAFTPAANLLREAMSHVPLH